jgi:hypothetical protein
VAPIQSSVAAIQHISACPSCLWKGRVMNGSFHFDLLPCDLTILTHTFPPFMRIQFLDEDLKDGGKAQEYYGRANFIEEGDRKSGLAAWVMQVPVGNELGDILEGRSDEEAATSGVYPPTNLVSDRLSAARSRSKHVIPEKRHSSVRPIDDDEEEEEMVGAGVARAYVFVCSLHFISLFMKNGYSYGHVVNVCECNDDDTGA